MNNDFEKYAKAIAEKALCDQKREEDDYMGADGLLYCGKCHTPKQYRVKGFSGDICPCVCQCVEKQREQDERARKIAANRQRCFPFMEQHKATFANDRGYNTAITQAMHNYVEHFETLRCVDGVWDADRHDDRLAFFDRVRHAVDGEFAGAFEDLDQCIASGGMGRDAFACIKSEESDSGTVRHAECPADDFFFAVGDHVLQSEDRTAFNVFEDLHELFPF